MKFGLIARSEDCRGLGVQSYGLYEALQPDRTLVVIDKNSGFPSHPERYPDATVVSLKVGPLKNSLAEEVVRDWWAGLDVVLTVETFYDWDLIEWARADGVATVVQGNPEFWMATNPQPDVWTWPTTWRLDRLPDGPVIPVPVEPRVSTAAELNLPNLRAVHIAGNAMGDRNGTEIVTAAMRRIPLGVRLTVFSQGPIGTNRSNRTSYPTPVADRWELYRGQHVLVLPRRYGGLCLPALEAMASGLAVVMPDCSPNRDWPVLTLQGDTGRTLRMQTGDVSTFDAYINDAANMLKHLAGDREALKRAQVRSLEWAAANTWAVHRPTYYELLDNAARSRR